MKKTLFSLILTCVLLAGCGGSADPEKASYEQISMDDAMALMEKHEDCVILDVRTQAEYDAGHIPGASCLPNEEIAEKTVSVLPDKDQMILVYCRSGNRSKQASQKLADLGYTNIKEFGGIIDWPGEIE